MKIEDYKGIVEKTAVFPQKVDNFGLAYAWLGLIGEGSEARTAFEDFLKNPTEINKKALVKETGDVCWYVTAICREVGIDEEEVFNIDKDVNELIKIGVPIDRFSENVKKFYRDGKKIDKKALTNTLSLLITGMFSATSRYGITLGKVLETNYDKLISRKEKGTIKGDGDDR